MLEGLIFTLIICLALAAVEVDARRARRNSRRGVDR